VRYVPRVLPAVLALIPGLAGCGGREHTNPFDPANPETYGEPGAIRAVAHCERVDLTWSDLGLADLEGFRLWREPLVPESAGPTELTDDPLPPAARHYTDVGLSNGVPYAYTLEFLFTRGSSAWARAVVARPGAALLWIADPCGYGLAALAPDGRALRRRISAGEAILALEIDEQAHRLYAARIEAGVVLVAGTADGEPLGEIAAPGASCLDWNPGLGVLAVGAFYEQSLSWFSAAGDLIASLALDGHPEDVALRDSATTWVALYEGQVLRASWHASGQAHVEVVTTALERAVRVADDSSGGGCWIADRVAGQVVYVGEDGARFRTAAGVIREPLDLAPAAQGGCWVADRARGAVLRVGQTCDVIEQHSDLGRVTNVAEDPLTGALWISVADAGEVWRLDGDGERAHLALDGCPRAIAGDWAGGCAR